MKRILLSLISFIIFDLHAAADKQPQIPNTFNGQPITPETIYDLMPPLPEDDRAALDELKTLSSTKVILTQLLAFKNFPNWRAKQMLDNTILGAFDITNESKSNYVFKLGEMNYVVKIAGPINRLQSILMAHGYWPGQQPTTPITKVDTYQTASRAAYFLVLKEFIERNKLKHVQAPETYLMRYPDTAKTVDDEHAFILQKTLPLSAKKITPEVAQTLSDDIIGETVQTIIAGGLWNIKNNLFLDESNNTVQFVDLEQPNNSAPADFFQRDAARYYGNLSSGLVELMDLFTGNPRKLALIRALIESNPVFNSPDFNQRYKNELIDALQKKAPSQEPTA